MYGPAVGSRKHGNEPLASVKGAESLDQLGHLPELCFIDLIHGEINIGNTGLYMCRYDCW